MLLQTAFVFHRQRSLNFADTIKLLCSRLHLDLLDGSLNVKSLAGSDKVPSNDYCIDDTLNGEQLAIVCFDDYNDLEPIDNTWSLSGATAIPDEEKATSLVIFHNIVNSYIVFR